MDEFTRALKAIKENKLSSYNREITEIYNQIVILEDAGKVEELKSQIKSLGSPEEIFKSIVKMLNLQNITNVRMAIAKTMDVFNKIGMEIDTAFVESLIEAKIIELQATESKESATTRFPWVGRIRENCGFSFSDGFGKITFNDAVVAVAAINAKNSKFRPLILASEEEFSELLAYIKNHPDEMQGRQLNFVIAGFPHWISGALAMKDKKLNLFISDTFGAESTYAQNFVDIAQKHFHDAKIFVSSEKRQNTSKGCSVFAITDVRKLFKIKNLFELLEKKEMLVSESKNNNGGLVRYIKSPIRLLTSSQTSDLLLSIKEHPEYQANMPINKKGDTISKSILRNFDIEKRKGTTKFTNRTLEHKLEMLHRVIAEYLRQPEITDKKLQSSMDKFTFDEFKKGAKQWFAIQPPPPPTRNRAPPKTNISNGSGIA